MEREKGGEREGWRERRVERSEVGKREGTVEERGGERRGRV